MGTDVKGFPLLLVMV